MAKHRTFTAENKFEVALEAAKGTKTLSELAQEYQLHSHQISEWKSHLLKSGGEVFGSDRSRQQHEHTPYLAVDDARVDLTLALARLSERLGVRCILTTFPGKLGGALLRAGLVDEIEVEFFPAIIGGAATPGLFEAPPLQPEEFPTRLQLLSAQIQPDGCVWLRYSVPGVLIE